MELAMLAGDSSDGGAVCGECGSEGPSRCNSALALLHFSGGCVNECSKRAIRLGERWRSSGRVIDLDDWVASDRGVAVRALSGWPLRCTSGGEGLTACSVHLRVWRIAGDRHKRAKVVGGHMVLCDPS